MTGWKRDLTTNRCRWELGDGATLRLPRGGTLKVLQGTVLVTREGDLDDHVLEAGSTHQLGASGLSVAWALADSEIQLEASRGRGLEASLGAALQRRLGMRST